MLVVRGGGSDPLYFGLKNTPWCLGLQKWSEGESDITLETGLRIAFDGAPNPIEVLHRQSSTAIST